MNFSLNGGSIFLHTNALVFDIRKMWVTTHLFWILLLMKRRIPQEGKQGESSKYVIQYLLLQQKKRPSSAFTQEEEFEKRICYFCS